MGTEYPIGPGKKEPSFPPTLYSVTNWCAMRGPFKLAFPGYASDSQAVYTVGLPQRCLRHWQPELTLSPPLAVTVSVALTPSRSLNTGCQFLPLPVARLPNLNWHYTDGSLSKPEAGAACSPALAAGARRSSG